MPRKGILLQMPGRGNGQGPQPTDSARKPVVMQVLQCTAEKMAFAWLYQGKTEYRLAEEYGLKRAEVEVAVRSVVRGWLHRKDNQIQGLRSAA